MIISEKQIMQLLNIARSYSEKLKKDEDFIYGQFFSYPIDQLLLEIQNQQSEELKEIK